jgi:hypothetical protein
MEPAAYSVFGAGEDAANTTANTSDSVSIIMGMRNMLKILGLLISTLRSGLFPLSIFRISLRRT